MIVHKLRQATIPASSYSIETPGCWFVWPITGDPDCFVTHQAQENHKSIPFFSLKGQEIIHLTNLPEYYIKIDFYENKYYADDEFSPLFWQQKKVTPKDCRFPATSGRGKSGFVCTLV
ncbi:MAG: hypothetical protein OEV78_10770 [Spirochaetia bacterium]|nr:hypothetical protein [Spirochaetia bacterium]